MRWTALATFDERKSRVIELRFFGGLSVEETAAVLKVSPDDRDGRLAAGKGLAAARDARRVAHMTPERWKQVEALYHAARTRPSGERVGVSRRRLS